jgi:hypothetical protein
MEKKSVHLKMNWASEKIFQKNFPKKSPKKISQKSSRKMILYQTQKK